MGKMAGLCMLIILAAPAKGATAPEDSSSQIGKVVTVEGVARVDFSSGVTLISFQTAGNFGQIIGVIPKDNAKNFTHPEYLNGKTIRMMGAVQSDHGKLQIKLTSVDQITVK
jgi:RecJ-like exonuclease